jgi:hypothetical protein
MDRILGGTHLFPSFSILKLEAQFLDIYYHSGNSIGIFFKLKMIYLMSVFGKKNLHYSKCMLQKINLSS